MKRSRTLFAISLLLALSLVLLAGCQGSGDDKKDESKSAQLVDFDELWDFTKVTETEGIFLAMLPDAEKSGDKSYHIELLTQIARAQGLQGEFDDAHSTLDEAEKLLTDDLKVARVRYLLERGRAYNSSGDPEKARPLFLDAFEIAKEAGEDIYTIDAAHMMGIIEPSDKQLDWNLKALKLAEESSDEQAKNWLGALYNNIGWAYHDLEEYEKALELFQKGLEWRIEKGGEGPLRIAKYTVGRALRSLGRIDEALEIQLGVFSELEEIGAKDGYVYEEIGECLLAQGKNDEAKEYFARAYEEFSKDPWLVENVPDRIEQLKNLAGL